MKMKTVARCNVNSCWGSGYLPCSLRQRQKQISRRWHRSPVTFQCLLTGFHLLLLYLWSLGAYVQNLKTTFLRVEQARMRGALGSSPRSQKVVYKCSSSLIPEWNGSWISSAFSLVGRDYRWFLCLTFLRQLLGFQHWRCFTLSFEIKLLQKSRTTPRAGGGLCAGSRWIGSICVSAHIVDRAVPASASSWDEGKTEKRKCGNHNTL